MARRRIVDWGSPDGIDPDTPVVDLHDPQDCGRDALVLCSDEERRFAAWLYTALGEKRSRALLLQSLLSADQGEEVARMRERKRRWHDKLWARWVVIATVLGAINLPQWIQLARGH